jgi:O-acetyl-ADP-ribose deacetylase (regulator of RNase III)
MKKIKFGNMLDTESGGILIHGCNAQGVMGSGIALEIKNRWPGCFAAYKDFLACRVDVLGGIAYYNIPDTTLSIANCITQEHFGKDGKKYVSYQAIQKAFTGVVAMAHLTGEEVHYPLIGAGLGGGDWAIISEIIDSVFEKYPYVNRTLWIKE